MECKTSVLRVLGPVVRLSGSGDVSLDGLPRAGELFEDNDTVGRRALDWLDDSG